MKKILLIWLVFMVSTSVVNAQWNESIDTQAGIFNSVDSLKPGKISVNGFYRFFGTYTRQHIPYQLTVPADTVFPRNFFIGDDAQLPNLLINVGGQFANQSSWGFDLRMFQFLNGSIGSSYGTQIPDSLRPSIQYPLGTVPLGGNLGTMLGMNLYGNFNTKFGQWATRIGGIQWVNISDLTVASFRGYNRFMLFERNPWDPMGKDAVARYQQYFEQGSIDQDQRWGNRAFQGAVIEGKDLPGGLYFLGLAGKSEVNGGFVAVPNYSFGGKLVKEFKDQSQWAVNTFNVVNYTDSLAVESFGLNMLTTEFVIRKNGHQVKGEMGGGKYFSPRHGRGWGEALQLKYTTPTRSGLPTFEIHVFRISPKVVNNSAIFWNTATREYTVNEIPAGSVGSSSLLLPFGSSMTRVGQITNNRQGFNLNLQVDRKKLKLNGGVGFSSEIEAAAGVITLGHPVNSVTRSRFWRWNFPANVGPYGRYSDIYRDVFETVKLSDDSSGVVVNKKFFNAAEMQVKYHGNAGGRNVYVFALLQCQSVGRKFSPIVVTNESAYVRQYASEIETYIELTPKAMLNGYLGIERTIGNYLTEINEVTRRPLNQTGIGLGLGLDLELGRNTRLYLRHRWFQFEDTSFPLDHFKGRELLVELKAFF
jgi:hypothetical protein